jgi:hypothetical protein
LDQIRKLISQVYGYEELVNMYNLERCGLIKRKEGAVLVEATPAWQILRKQLRLIEDQPQGNDISYVSAGESCGVTTVSILTILNRLRSSVGEVSSATRIFAACYVRSFV